MRKLIKTSNGRWGFAPTEEERSWGRSIGDEFTCGEQVEIQIGDTWHRGRFEAVAGDYYIILRNGFSFFPMGGTTARRPI